MKRIIIILSAILAVLVAACGTVATPEPLVTDVPATDIPPTDAPTDVPATDISPTDAPTDVPATDIPPTDAPPTDVPATDIPPTDAPPTDVPATDIPPTDAPTQAPEPTTEISPRSQGNMGNGPGGGQGNMGEGGMGMGEGGMMAMTVAGAIEAGDVANGERLFNQFYDEAAFACATCHSVDESMQRLIGPPLYGIYERAEERIAEPGTPMNVVGYIHQSINVPGAYMVPPDDAGPYPENLMPAVYADLFTQQELDDLTAYLLTLGNPDYDG